MSRHCKSTIEAELLALSRVSKEVEHIVRIFKAIRFNPEQDIIINYNKRDPYSIYKTLIYRYLLILASPRGPKWKLYYTIGTNKQNSCK